MGDFWGNTACGAGDLFCWFDHHEGLGVWVGACASFFVALVAVLIVFLQRFLERRVRRRSLGFSALLKMRGIHSNLVMLNKILARQEAQAAKLDLSGAWQTMESVANPASQISFSNDEIEILYWLGDDPLFDQLQLMQMFHNSALNLIESYSTRRQALTDLLPAEMKGTIGTFALTPELNGIVGPRAAELDSMIDSMREHWPADSASAGEMLMRLNALIESKLGLKVSLAPAPKPMPNAEA